MKDNLKKIAEDNYIEVIDIDGMLRFTPKRLHTHILLEIQPTGLDDIFILLRHRDDKLTKKYKGRNVTREWVYAFLYTSAPLVLKIIQKNYIDSKEIVKVVYCTFDGDEGTIDITGYELCPEGCQINSLENKLLEYLEKILNGKKLRKLLYIFRGTERANFFSQSNSNQRLKNSTIETDFRGVPFRLGYEDPYK